MYTFTPAIGFMPPVFRLNLRMFDVTLNTNVTTDTALTDEMKTHYQRTLIDTAEPELLHDRFGQVANIPAGSGKRTEWRYFDPLPKALTPLTEGVSPAGSKLAMHTLDVTPNQYGDFVAYSDIISKTTIDPIVVQATLELGSQAGRTMDTITREVLAGGSNRMFAPSVASNGTITDILLRSSIDGGCLYTPAVNRAAVNELKRMNAKKINGKYAVIIHPDTTNDMMGNTEWIDAQKHVNPEKIYAGNIGEMAGAVFNETTEAKIIAPADIFTGVNRLSLKTALDGTGSTDITLNETISAAQAAELTAAIAAGTVQIYVGGNLATLASVTAGAPGTGKLVATAAVKNVAANAMVCGTGAGKLGHAIYFTTIFGFNAYGVTAIDGLGLQHIVKELGSGGTADPLNQRGTIGWKGTKAAKRLIEAYMIRIEHTTSLGLTAQSN